MRDAVPTLGSAQSSNDHHSGRLAETLESHTGVEPPTVETLTTDLNILDIVLAKQDGRPKSD